MSFNGGNTIMNGSSSSIILFVALGVGIVFVNVM